MSKFGLPYKGSKSFLAERIVKLLPKASTLYEPFAGGCAITHCAIKNKKYNNYVLNDLCKAPQVFKDAYDGKKFSIDWISHERFDALKKEDFFVSLIWSFGCDCASYMYSRKIEPYKKSLPLRRCFW